MVQVSGGAPDAQHAASPRQSRSNLRDRGKQGRHNFRAGPGPRSFFLRHAPLSVAIPPAKLFPAVRPMTAPNPIEQSFELAAQHCCDLTPDVYRRLFHDRPEARAMFRNDGGDLVRGSMLALAIEAILDFAGERTGHFRLIACEVASHEAYGTPQELFIDFFRVIRDTLRELLAAEWSSDMNDAWEKLLVGIAAFAAGAA